MIYVDKPTSYIKEQISQIAQRYGTHVKWCHLFADDVQELHEFAGKLGLRRSWFQNKRNFPHYDLVQSKRQQAISLGAQEIDLRSYIKSKLGYN
ncbi:MAG: DUF4031 domain-containing protein [Candidatus Nanoarchaeia archaeon]|jgi:hypothetical protein|nr:DUF4031 domain-containing protein [Candidatus Nanoarchaeia archaeon]